MAFSKARRIDLRCATKTGILIHFSLLASALLLFLIYNSFSIHSKPSPHPGHDQTIPLSPDPRVEFLLRHWERHYFRPNETQAQLSYLLRAPHIQDCRKQSRESLALDSRDAQSGESPEWTKYFQQRQGELGRRQFTDARESDQALKVAHGPQPPWIKGGEEDNLPMTRPVQTDLWLHQHPKNCSDESVRFLLNEWINSPNLGLGGQIVSMTGMFAAAMSERRILVTKNFNRADHDGCKGASRAQWSCYFAPETSEECRARAMKLASQKEARKKGVVVNIKSFPKDTMWFGKVPEYWGRPWEIMQPLDVVDGELVGKHKAADRQWWRAQALRYLMRFPSEYLCTLMNEARHEAFGTEAARLVVENLPKDPSEFFTSESTEKLGDFWTSDGPWLPRPVLSMHVRQGDKGSEMKLFQFGAYMELASRVRARVPQLRDIWLATEMQNVVDESRNFSRWRFHYTSVPRQNGTTSMGAYESSLGRLASSSNAFVNFMMAVDCDYFVGALGSTWSFLIDCMRVTSGKLKAGFLSVNRDRYW